MNPEAIWLPFVAHYGYCRNLNMTEDENDGMCVKEIWDEK
jgi:hypothetical protein